VETLTEPHKFTAAVLCMSAVCRVLVRPGPLLLPQGPAHVLPILHAVLPGIDSNDIKKTMTVLQLVSIIGRLVPFRDAPPPAADHPAGRKAKLPRPPISFKAFVLVFLDKVFALIENSTLEEIRHEQSNADARLSAEETSVSVGVASCFDSILHEADEDIQHVVVEKLEDFLRCRILEPKVAGKMAGGLCRTCVRIAPEKFLSRVLPRSCGVLCRALTEIEPESERYLGDEVMFHLLLLAELVSLPGYHLLPYISQVGREVMDQKYL
jgi:proteasome activator subunit 4